MRKRRLFLHNYVGQYSPAITHRKRFDGEWYQHYHPNITYEGPIAKRSANALASELREKGYNARVVRAYGDYAVYHRRKR